MGHVLECPLRGKSTTHYARGSARVERMLLFTLNEKAVQHWIQTSSLHTLTCMTKWYISQYNNDRGHEALLTKASAIAWIQRIRLLRSQCDHVTADDAQANTDIEMSMPFVCMGIMMVHLGYMERDDLAAYILDIMEALDEGRADRADRAALKVSDWHVVYLCTLGHWAAARELIRRGRATSMSAVVFRLICIKAGFWTWRTRIEDVVSVLHKALECGVAYSLAVEKRLGLKRESSFLRRKELLYAYGVCPEAIRLATHVYEQQVYRVPYLAEGTPLWNVNSAPRLQQFNEAFVHVGGSKCPSCLKSRHSASTASLWRAMMTSQHHVSAYVKVDTLQDSADVEASDPVSAAMQSSATASISRLGTTSANKTYGIHGSSYSRGPTRGADRMLLAASPLVYPSAGSSVGIDGGQTPSVPTLIPQCGQTQLAKLAKYAEASIKPKRAVTSMARPCAAQESSMPTKRRSRLFTNALPLSSFSLQRSAADGKVHADNNEPDAHDHHELQAPVAKRSRDRLYNAYVRAFVETEDVFDRSIHTVSVVSEIR